MYNKDQLQALNVVKTRLNTYYVMQIQTSHPA